MGYTLKKEAPFVITIEGEKEKKIELISYKKLGVDELAMVDFGVDTPAKEKVEKISGFFTHICPELGDLGIGAAEWVELYKAYSGSQGE